MRFLLLPLLLMMPLSVTHARPAPKNDPDTAASRRHYEEGAHLYAEGKYAESIAELRLAEAIQHSPQIDYNIALCEEHLEHWEAAANAYAHYLAAWPLPQDAKIIRDRIRKLRERAQTLASASPPPNPQINFVLPPEAATPPAPAASPTPAAKPPAATPTLASTTHPPAKPITKKWWFWTALGAGIATLAVGVGLAAGLSHDDAIPHPTDGTYTVIFP